MNVAEILPLLRIYDLRDPDAWHQARQHRRLWGRLFTDIHALGPDHIALVFRPGGERWRAWERSRLQLILGQDDPVGEAA